MAHTVAVHQGKKKKGFPHFCLFIVSKASAHQAVGLGIRNKKDL